MSLDYYNEEHINVLNEHIISQLNVVVCDSKITVRSKKINVERKQTQGKFMFHGTSVCLNFWIFVDCNGKKKIKKSAINGIEPKLHGRLNLKGGNALSQDVQNHIITFMKKVDNMR